jgi:hypothetical protein
MSRAIDSYDTGWSEASYHLDYAGQPGCDLISPPMTRISNVG